MKTPFYFFRIMRPLAVPAAVMALVASAAIPATGFAQVVGVCERTGAVAEFIVQKINEDQEADKTCADITVQDLESLKRVSIAGQGVAELQADDFAGLPNLEILNIRSNPYTTLPEGLFAGLDNLHTLVIIGTELRYFPDDFLADIPNLKFLHCFRNQVRTISLSVLQRFENLAYLETFDFDHDVALPERERLEEIFAGTNILQLH